MTKFHLDRDPLTAGERSGPLGDLYRADGTDRFGRVGVDAPRVSRDVALELMVHHLQLAAMYYEATPDDDAAVAAEVERLLISEIPYHETPALRAARPWLEAIRAHYERLRREQGE
jgi:hypothetical protein